MLCSIKQTTAQTHTHVQYKYLKFTFIEMTVQGARSHLPSPPDRKNKTRGLKHSKLV